VADEVHLFGTAADVFGGGIDEIDADMVLGAGKAVGRQPIHDAAVSVFVFDGVLVIAGGDDSLLFGMNDGAGTQVLIGDHELIAIFIHREPVKGGIHGLKDKTVFAEACGGIGGRMRVLRVGVKAADPAFHSIANFNANASAIGTLDGHLAALATVARRVNGHFRGHRAGRHSFPIRVTRRDDNAVIDQRLNAAGGLHNGELHDAVVHRPSRAVVGDGHRGVGRRFGNHGHGES